MKLCHHYSIAYNNSITDFNSHVYTQFLITKRRLVLVTFTTHVFAGTEKTNALVKGLRGCLFDRENIEILSTVLVRSPSASVTCIVGLSLISSAICRTQTDRFLEIFGGQYKKFNVPNMGRTAKMLTARSSFQLLWCLQVWNSRLFLLVRVLLLPWHLMCLPYNSSIFN
jgi:hypothetical protein